jgi:hypothetical protein
MCRSLRPRPMIIMLALLVWFALCLTGCLADVRDAQITPSAPATRTTAPTGQPTDATTSRATPTPTPGERVKNTPGDFDFYVGTSTAHARASHQVTI